MRNIIVKIKENKVFSTFLIGIICVIIMTVAFMVNSYADMSFIVEKIVNYNAGGTVNIPLKIYTDVVRYHAKANGYDVKKGDESFNNASIYDSSLPDTISAPGYGQYVFKVHTDLFQFIEFCHEKNSAMVEQAALINDENPLKTCDYSKLMSFNGQANGNYKPYMDNFWTNMCILGGDTFRDWQDEYFFKEYTNKAISRNGYTARSLKNIEDDCDEWEDSHTYLSALTSYLYMYMETKNSPVEDIKRGDMLPFIYYKYQTDETNPKEIAKYAYVALIENFDNFGINAETARSQWESEYYNFFDDYDLTEDEIETLEEWYGVAKTKYGTDKGRVRNNLLGSTIDTIIKSDYNMETQIEATKYYINQIFNELGIETSISEALSRNELMAKYMMENEQLKDMIKDYNKTIEFMTENLQRGTNNYENTHTVVTSDFQRLDFPYTINERYSHHSDDDGITDGGELGSEKWINITEFVKKAYESMPLSDKKNTFEAQVDDIIYKNQGIIKKEGMGNNIKVLYRTFNYTSNPKLNDTDFDGLNDNIDTKKLDNYINSTNKVDEDKKVDVTYGSDFRYFFINNSKFNDELAMMSFIVSNLATDNRTINIDQDGSVGYINIDTYMREMGIMPIEVIDLYGGKSKCYTGVKEIQYYDIKKYVYCAFVGGFTDIESYVDLLYNDDGSEEEKFKEIADIIYDKLQNYTKNGEYCYWVTGMNIAGGVANLLACELKGEECYAYIMDPPNISRIDNSSYNYIMNIINTDNLIPKIYKDTRNHINGKKYYNSIRYDLMNIYRKYDSVKNYRGDFKKTNRIKDEIQEAKNNISDEEEHKEYFTQLTINLYSRILSYNSSYLYNSGNIVKTVDKNGEEHIHENITEIDRIYAMNAGVIISPGVEFSLNPIMPQSDIDSTTDPAKADPKVPLIKGMDLFSDKNLSDYAETDNRPEIEQNIDENIFDAPPFDDLADVEDYLDDMVNYGELKDGTDWCVKIEDEKYRYKNKYIKMYSDYTIPKNKAVDEGIECYDINYSKFWDEDARSLIQNKIDEDNNNEKGHFNLYKFGAGDFHRLDVGFEHLTRMVYGKYHGAEEDKDNKNEHKNKHDKENREYIIDNINNNGEEIDLYYDSTTNIKVSAKLFDGRIVVAMPLELLVKSNENNADNDLISKMHIYENYDHSSDSCNGGFNQSNVSNVAYENKWFKYVDVVVEVEDEDGDKSNNHQFVIPFIVVDVKWLDNAPVGGMHFTMFTDNRYGHVYENIGAGFDINKYKMLFSNSKIGANNYLRTFINKRMYSHMNPIEPYLKITKNGKLYSGSISDMVNTRVNNELNKFLFGEEHANDVRVISMRIYDKEFDESRKSSYKWWSNIKINKIPNYLVNKTIKHEVNTIVEYDYKKEKE